MKTEPEERRERQIEEEEAVEITRYLSKKPTYMKMKTLLEYIIIIARTKEVKLQTLIIIKTKMQTH